MIDTEQGEILDEKTQDLIIAYIIRYDDIDKAREKAGISKEKMNDLFRDDRFDSRLYEAKNDSLRTLLREPGISLALAQWLENTELEILPLLYNFDGLDNDDELRAFIKEHNIYYRAQIYTINPASDKSFLEMFRTEIKEIRNIIDKHLGNIKLSAEEIHKIEMQHSRKNLSILYGDESGSGKIVKTHKGQLNPGSINIQRAYSDLGDVMKGKKQLKRCAAEDCGKIFVARTTGGSDQKYHSRTCGARMGKRESRKRMTVKVMVFS